MRASLYRIRARDFFSFRDRSTRVSSFRSVDPSVDPSRVSRRRLASSTSTSTECRSNENEFQFFSSKNSLLCTLMPLKFLIYDIHKVLKFR